MVAGHTAHHAAAGRCCLTRAFEARCSAVQQAPMQHAGARGDEPGKRLGHCEADSPALRSILHTPRLLTLASRRSLDQVPLSSGVGTIFVTAQCLRAARTRTSGLRYCRLMCSVGSPKTMLLPPPGGLRTFSDDRCASCTMQQKCALMSRGGRQPCSIVPTVPVWLLARCSTACAVP